MRFSLYLCLVLIFLTTFDEKSFSLTDNQIKIICKKEKRKLPCIKSLQDKRSNLKNGNLIEIPVIPHQR